ncbi:MAG TPA: FMN-binding negative transcriptional regulator [Novosphingobium sp.]|nr:FMN-binding negative transcriptional regulator [Novosphingobium sp.]
MNASPFGQYGPRDVADIVAAYPLAWAWAQGGDPGAGALLPMLGEYDEAGRLTHLLGHMSRANPLIAALAGGDAVGFLFTGPQAYVSPEDAGRRDWGPTWIYARVAISGRITFLPAETRDAVEQLARHMEAGRPQPWTIAEIDHRAGPMLERIIAFRVAVDAVHGWFKLGQDESPEVLRAILAATADPGMKGWIMRFNRDRLENGA